MIVYVDILIFLNLFVNFFILKITAALCKDTGRISRTILGSAIGALFSLYIFLPQSNALTEMIFRLAVSGVVIIVSFKFDSLKSFLRRISVFFAVSFLYAGFMLGVWFVFKPQNLAVNNGIVYVNISPVLLILTTLAGYVIISVIRYLSNKEAPFGNRCGLTIEANENIIKITALVDTGNSLTDIITKKPVIIIEKGVAEKLLKEIPTPENFDTYYNKNTYDFRIIPYSTVGGTGLLTAFTPKNITAESNGEKIPLNNVLIAISNEKLGEDYKAIVGPTALKK